MNSLESDRRRPSNPPAPEKTTTYCADSIAGATTHGVQHGPRQWHSGLPAFSRLLQPVSPCRADAAGGTVRNFPATAGRSLAAAGRLKETKEISLPRSPPSRPSHSRWDCRASGGCRRSPPSRPSHSLSSDPSICTSFHVSHYLCWTVRQRCREARFQPYRGKHPPSMVFFWQLYLLNGGATHVLSMVGPEKIFQVLDGLFNP
jgi:hypothetical protein